MIESASPHSHNHGHHHHDEPETEPETLVNLSPEEQQALLFFEQAPEFTVLLVRHSHWDFAWFRRRPASRIREVEAIDDIVEAGLPYTFEQTITAEEYVKGGGEPKEKAFKGMCERGELEMIGMHVQPDIFLSPEEALFWNFDTGRRKARELGATPSKAPYIPDTFGFPDSMPKMLRAAGMESFIYTRGNGEEIRTAGAVFNWESDDGSSVLAIPMQGGYGNGNRLARAMIIDGKRQNIEDRPELWESAAQISITNILAKYADRYKQIDMPHMLLGNGCDFEKIDKDLEPILGIVEKRMRRQFPGLSYKFGSYQDYVELVSGSVDPAKLTTFKGEMRSGAEHGVLRGVDSARMPLKQEVERADREIYAAEAITSLLLLGRAYGVVPENEHTTRHLIYESQRSIESLLPVLSHDAVTGCGSDDAYSFMYSLSHDAVDAARQVQRNSAAALAANVDPYSLYPATGWSLVLSIRFPRTGR